jgi:hypothetical protein
MTEEEMIEWARNEGFHVVAGTLTKPTGIEVTDWENFLAEIRKKNLPTSTITVLNEIYDWFRSEDFRNLGAKVKVGQGKKLGAMHFYFAKIPSSVFSVWTDGRLSIDYGGFSGYLDGDRVVEFHHTIKSIEGFRDVPDDYTKYPSKMISQALADQPEAMATLKDALHTLGNFMQIYNPPFRKRNPIM